MPADRAKSCTAFADARCIASGDAGDVAIAVKEFVDSGDATAILVFDDETAEPVEFDLRGSAADVATRYGALKGAASAGSDSGASDSSAASAPDKPVARTPGRPKLGVVSREVTLLPRHWEWLAAQPGGASVTLRKLVEQARKAGSAAERARTARDTTYRFAVAMAGNEGGFEEAMRALYAGDQAGFEARITAWPGDVRAYAHRLAAEAFAPEGE